MEEKVKSALAEIAKHLQADGGDVELVAIEGNVVKVKLTGACAACAKANPGVCAGRAAGPVAAPVRRI